MRHRHIAINGLGRMGKLLMRVLHQRNLLESVVLINDAKGDPSQHALLLEFDTVHGKWNADIEPGVDALSVNGNTLQLTRASSIEALPLSALEVDLVIDCTGAFRTPEQLQPYCDANVKKVLVSCPVHDEQVANIVYGVNESVYDADRHPIVTGASCTTNCIAPVIKVLHEQIGIKHGSITTLHNVTNTQTLVDRPAKDLRRARSALNSLIPTTTGSATAISLIYPELSGRLTGHAVRVPLLNASLTDCVFEMQRPTSADEINRLLENASENRLKGILGVEQRPLVSADYVSDPRSAIVDAASTLVVNQTQAKLFVWYDNEWGYVNRLADIASMILETQ